MYALQQQGATGIGRHKINYELLKIEGYKYRRYAQLKVFEGTMQGIT
jgi:hypothetical protein